MKFKCIETCYSACIYEAGKIYDLSGKDPEEFPFEYFKPVDDKAVKFMESRNVTQDEETVESKQASDNTAALDASDKEQEAEASDKPEKASKKK